MGRWLWSVMVVVLMESCSQPPRRGRVDAGDLAAAPDPYFVGADGGCVVKPVVPGDQLIRRDRWRREIEQLVLEASPEMLVVDDDTYARAERDWYLLSRLAGPSTRFRTSSEYLRVDFEVLTYSGDTPEWTCLNAAYRTAPSYHSSNEFIRAYLLFERPIQLAALFPAYARLPGVTNVSAVGELPSERCESNGDTCLQRERARGTWTWLNRQRDVACRPGWSRLVTEADGGSTFEQWHDDAGTPTHWLDGGCVLD
jgi:hypothetical protein